MIRLDHETAFCPQVAEGNWPVFICLLGDFRLLKANQPLALRGGGKAEALLCSLALRPAYSLSRETVLEMLWPRSDAALAGQSLNSLVYSLHKLLGGSLGGAAPVLHVDGCYRLNVRAGVGVDVADFDALAVSGDLQARAGDSRAAASCYRRALRLYRGDLCVSAEVSAVVERERLRALYLTVLARLADFAFGLQDYSDCLDYSRCLLAADPCREDAHRLVMRCYVRLGERSQALRQFRLCETILRNEFDAAPEPATTSLFRQVRLDPDSI